jgi:AraC-like DNA-binding protein
VVSSGRKGIGIDLDVSATVGAAPRAGLSLAVGPCCALHAASSMARARARRDITVPTGQWGFSTARLNLMKADVLKNLDKSVARASALSGRQAQRLFASSGTTFSEFVLEQRLLLARRLLLHESGRDRTVSDVAYTVGFNDLSYFHRSFRKRFGVTPCDMRTEFGRER